MATDYKTKTKALSQFFSACKKGNVVKVAKYIACRDNISEEVNVAVRLASLYGNLEVVKCLVANGADVRSMDDCCVSWAAKRGHLDVVKYLVSQGADARTYNDEAASTAGNFEVAKYLVTECGANIDRVSDRCRAYIEFCERIACKNKISAQKKIYYWWIPICYDMDHPSGCGQRMAQRNLDAYLEILKAKTIN